MPGKPGVYVRYDKRGRARFEITYRDSTGKQRWQTIEGGVTAAVHARQDLLAKMRRGERVVSSRITFTELAAQWLRQKTTSAGRRSPGTSCVAPPRGPLHRPAARLGYLH